MTTTFKLSRRTNRVKGEKRVVSVYEAFIDDIDADLLSQGWHTATRKGSENVYVKRGNPSVLLHRVIMARIMGRGLDTKEYVDHIDRNGLNNTRSNLRLATHSQNLVNSKVHKTNKLGVKGVNRHGNKYQSRIAINGKLKYLGLFDTAKEAHEAYLAASKEKNGDFTRGE